MSHNTHEGIRNLSPVSSISLSLVLLFHNRDTIYVINHFYNKNQI